MAYLYLTLAVVAELLGSNLLKYTDGFTKLVPTIFALLAYGGSFYFLSLTLKYFPLNIVYAVWGGMGIVLITLISVFVFHVSINWQTILGTILIVVGVVIVNLYGIRIKVNYFFN